MKRDKKHPTFMRRKLSMILHNHLIDNPPEPNKNIFRRVEKMGKGFKEQQVYGMADDNKPLPRLEFWPKLYELLGEPVEILEEFIRLCDPNLMIVDKRKDKQRSAILQMVKHLVEVELKERANGNE